MEIGDLIIGYYSERAVSGNMPIEQKGNIYFAITDDKVLHLARLKKDDSIEPMKSEFSYNEESLDYYNKIEKVDYSFIPKEKRILVFKRLFGGG